MIGIHSQKLNTMRTTILILLSLSTGQLIAQSPKIFEEYKNKFPEDMAVYLQFNREVHINVEGDTLSTTTENYYDLLHLQPRSKALAKDKVYLSEFKKVITLDAKTLVPNKNKYKEIPVTNFVEKNEQSSGVFYDDFRSKSFVYPAVEPGVRTILREKKEVRDPHFVTPFYFASFVPVISAKVTIITDKSIELKHKLFNEDEVDIEFNKKAKGDKIIYTWEAQNLDDYKIESDAPKSSYYLPHLAYYVGEYTANGKKKQLLSSLDDLYGWYSSLTCNVNQKEDSELKSVVEGLVNDGDSEEEKVRKIFYWVQENIKYIAFEDGMRGFIPHDAAYVNEKRYGDCKDMASITNDMLKMAGIKSYLTWIGSRDIPYSYSELPTPMVDNHMIVTYENEGELYFLDATSQYTRFGMPSSFIQGKEALLAVNNDEYKVAKVPVMTKETNIFVDSTHIKLDGKVVKGSGTLDLNGYLRVNNSYRITNKKDEKEKRFIKAFLQKGNNKFFVDNYEVENLKDKDAPLRLKYDYRIEDYFKQIGDELYFNLTLDKAFNNQKIDLENRKLPLENDYKYTDRQVTIFELPEGYQVDYLPPSASFEHEFFGFSITYKNEGGKISQKKDIYINYLILEKENFADWNKMIKKLNEAYREALILKKQE